MYQITCRHKAFMVDYLISHYYFPITIKHSETKGVALPLTFLTSSSFTVRSVLWLGRRVYRRTVVSSKVR
jgi:hypothetical protein